MIFFYLTTYTLDILSGVAWWVVKKSISGVYYIAYGYKNSDQEHQIILTDKEISNNKKLLNNLLINNKNQQIEIKKLTEKIELLNNYIKDKK
tara:strand:- start:630 stop:905 length:276 start_codon:yes stop_codon:yes gene_type:complete